MTPNRVHLQTLGVGYFSILHQLHQHERTYQADAKEADYKNMEEAAIDEPADAWYAGHDQDDNDQYYASDYIEEVLVNFHGIESVCIDCQQSFSSRSLLHKQLEAVCLPDNLMHPQASTWLPTSLPVWISKATFDSIGSGIAFRGWSYSTASVTLSPHAVPL